MNIIQEIDEKIAELQAQKQDIQNKCSHPVNIQKWHKEDDEYGTEIGPGWYTYDCKLCGKRWSETA